jgi:site-specific DNA-methyltransferase (adenine-specific)/adenine-specific DNA-methyltransferase
VFTIDGPTGLQFNPPPGRFWRCNREQYDRWLADNRIWFGKKRTGRPMLKAFLSEVQDGLTPNTWWPHDFAGHNKEATLELKAMFAGSAPFDTPKPVKLITRILQLFSDKSSLILDSFAGSGTTGHATLAVNRHDGGQRKFILVEIEKDIAAGPTADRLRKAVSGFVSQKTLTTQADVEALGGGFRYCTLAQPLFDEQGNICREVTFADLAAHVYFTETGEPIPKRAGNSPLLGVHNGRAIYLLFNGVLGDKRPGGGNVLTHAISQALPGHDGPRVVYGEASRLSATSLKQYRITFRQVPFELKVD